MGVLLNMLADDDFKITNKYNPRPNFADISRQDAAPSRVGAIRPSHLANIF